MVLNHYKLVVRQNLENVAAHIHQNMYVKFGGETKVRNQAIVVVLVGITVLEDTPCSLSMTIITFRPQLHSTLVHVARLERHGTIILC